MSTPQDRELAVLIRDEADRIRALVDRMEIFGEKPIARTAVNIHRVLEHVRKLAQSGFAPHVRFHEVYDPSLPPVWGNRDQLVQVVLNLVKNAAEAVTQDGPAEPGDHADDRRSSTACAWLCRAPRRGSTCRCWSPCAIMARASPRTSGRICSSRS